MAELQENQNEESSSPEDEDERLTIKDRIQLFLQAHWEGIVCVVSPIILLAILVPFPAEKYQWCAYTLMLMAIYWVTECIPLPITSFLPIFIFPFTGVMSTSETCYCYMNDTIVMFLGSLILAYAVEQSGLHRRMALCAIRIIGYSHYRLLFAMSFTTMFISMWITNTAATTMMVPINFALLKVFEDQNLLNIYDSDSVSGNSFASDMTICYFCSTSFSATIGGVGTLVGTATNLVFKGLYVSLKSVASFLSYGNNSKYLCSGNQRAYPKAPEYLSFPLFSAFSLPFMLAMEGLLYLSMIITYFGFLRPNSKAAKRAQISKEGLEAAKAAVDKDWGELGKITLWEIMVIILFGGAMLLFFCRSPQIFIGWADKVEAYFGVKQKFIRDSAAAMFVGFFMFLLPSTFGFFKNFTAKPDSDGNLIIPNTPERSILDWTIMNEVMPYSFMFLLGGGFALSEAAKKEHSNLNGKIGEVLKSLRSMPNYFIIFLIITFTVFITNFASNVAVCNVITPIVMLMAAEINQNPLWYNIASGFSCSFCFCLPVGTPGNLIVQGAAKIPTNKMLIAGIFPTISSIFLTWMFICFWAPVIWPDLQLSTINSTFIDGNIMKNPYID